MAKTMRRLALATAMGAILSGCTPPGNEGNKINLAQSRPALSTVEFSVPESAGAAEVRVRIEKAMRTDTTVRVSTSAESALAGTDYTPVETEVVIPAGAVEGPVVLVPILEDAANEDAERLVVTLSVVGALVPNNTSLYITIVDDDAPPETPPVLVNDPITRDENSGTASFRLRLSRPASAVLSFRVRGIDGTAISSHDYATVDTTITVPASSIESDEFPISILDDTAVEGDEAFTLSVTEISATGVAPTTIAVRIVDDDAVGADSDWDGVMDAGGQLPITGESGPGRR